MSKRISCRAIVIEDGKLVVMKREKEGRLYYTFPGGGKEENETNDECVVRECIEEFGIVVKPQKHVYTYENEKTLQYFYVCDWMSGEIGTGVGEEFQEDRNRGTYEPMLIEISNIENLPLMPPEVALALFEDFNKFGSELSDELKSFIVE